MIITIDGPAGSGKSFLARNLAKDLGFYHLNSGMLYRACAKVFFDHKLLPDETMQKALAHLELLEQIQLVPYNHTFRVNFSYRNVPDEDLAHELNQLAWDAFGAQVAGHPAVRAKVVQLQRRAAELADLVIDGRDCGTVVFPDADLKFFLTASLQARALRIAGRNFKHPTPAQVAEITARIAARDQNDSTRAISPLVAASDAIKLDNSELSAAQTLALAKRIVLEHKLV